MTLDKSELRWLETELSAIRALIESESKLRDAYRKQNRAAIEKLSVEFTERARNLEETLNRRIDALHSEVDAKIGPILDPQTGIYSQLTSGNANLRNWAIALLTAMLLLILAVVIRLYLG